MVETVVYAWWPGGLYFYGDLITTEGELGKDTMFFFCISSEKKSNEVGREKTFKKKNIWPYFWKSY